MRLRGRWIKRARRDPCTPPVPRLSDGVGSLWRCRHGGTYELTLNYRSGDRQFYRWDAASEPGGYGVPRGHVRTDPACLRYRAPRPGSRRDRASRGRSCDYCMVLRRDFGVIAEPGGSE